MPDIFDTLTVEDQVATPGMVEPGNIDLTTRPRVRNSDGSISTVRSIGVNIDGTETLLPTVSDDGRIISNEEAIQNYHKSGKHLGKFSSVGASNAFAKQLHDQQAQSLVDDKVSGDVFDQAAAQLSTKRDIFDEAASSTELEEWKRNRPETTPRKTGFFENLAANAVKPVGEMAAGVADAVASNTDVEGGDEFLKQRLKDELTLQRMEQPTGPGKVGAFLGNLAGTLGTALATGGAGPAGLAMQFGTTGYGQAFLKAGLRALGEGHTFDDAVQIGKKAALVGGATQAAVGLIPGGKEAEPFVATLKSGAKFAAGGAAGQVAENVTERGLGLQTPLMENVGETALTMGALPPGMRLLGMAARRAIRGVRRGPPGVGGGGTGAAEPADVFDRVQPESEEQPVSEKDSEDQRELDLSARFRDLDEKIARAKQSRNNDLVQQLKVRRNSLVAENIALMKELGISPEERTTDASAIRTDQGESAQAGQQPQTGEANRGSDVQQAAPGAPEPVAQGAGGEQGAQAQVAPETKEAKTLRTAKAVAGALADEMEWQFDATPQIGSIKLDGLTEAEKKALLAIQPKQWGFTPKDTGLTFYVPEGASREEILTRFKEKNQGEASTLPGGISKAEGTGGVPAPEAISPAEKDYLKKRGIRVLGIDAQTATHPQFAFELDDGTVVFGPSAAHFDLLGSIPESLHGRIVNSGFVENGKYARGGDFSAGIKPGETAKDYYATPTKSAEPVSPKSAKSVTAPVTEKPAGWSDERFAIFQKQTAAAKEVADKKEAEFKAKQAPRPEPQKVEAPKAEPQKVEAANLETLLQAPVEDVTRQKANVAMVDQRLRELRSDREKVDAEIKAVEKLIMPQRGSPYSRRQIKASARKSDVAKYRELKERLTKLVNEQQAVENLAANDRRVVDASEDAKIISDKNQPLARRLDRQVRRMEGNAPPELIAARDAEMENLIKAKHPDATPAEVEHLREHFSRAVYFGEDTSKGGTPDLNQIRRQSLDAAINGPTIPNHLFSESLKERIAKARSGPLSAKELADLKQQIVSETKAVHAKSEADRIQAEKERLEEEAKGREMMREAQEVARSGGKRTAKEVRTDLAARIKAAIDEMLGKDAVTLTKREDGSYLAQSTSEFGDAAFGEIEPAGKDKFKVTTSQPGHTDRTISAVVSSREEAEWLIKAMATGGSGKAVIGVPGDGVFRLNRHGPTLLKLWQDAQRISISAGSKPGIKSGGPAQEPPASIKTFTDWKEAKEYHGLEPLDKISTWSPALEAVAKKVNPEAPHEVTTHDVENFIKTKQEGGGKTIEAAKQEVKDAYNDLKKMGISPQEDLQRQFRLYTALYNLAKAYVAKGIKTAEEFAAAVGQQLSGLLRKAWDDATAGKAEVDPAKVPALSEDERVAAFPERQTTQVLGAEMEIGGRPGSSAQADVASINHQHEILRDSGFTHVTRPADRGLVAFEPDGFLHEAEGHRLIKRLQEELPRNWDVEAAETPYPLTALFNSIAHAWQDGSLKEVVGEPIARKLFTMTQSVVSHWGLMLQSRQRFGTALEEIAKDPLVQLRYEWSKSYGGANIDSFFERVMSDLTERLGPAAAELLRGNPDMRELLEATLRANMQDSGSRVYRRVQQLFKPKSAKRLEQLLGDSRFMEAVQEVIEQLHQQGVEPKPRPGKKALTPKEQLQYLAQPEIADKVDAAIRGALRQAERKAARASFMRENHLTEDDMMAYDDRTAKADAEGPDPTAEQIDQGFATAEFAHWGRFRQNLADYSPVTLDLAQRVIRGDFRGVRFKDAPPRAEDLRIDMRRLAVSPDAEIRRVFDAWHDALEGELTNATDETRQRVRQMMEREMAGQIERIRLEVRNPLFADKVKRGAPLTAEEQMLKLVNAKLFADQRLDVPEMVGRLAESTKVKNLLPTMADLIQRTLETPFYQQAELKIRFVDDLVNKLGIDPAQATKAWAVFERAFASKFAEAKARAAERAFKSITPQEETVIKGRGLTRKILDNINAGNLDGGPVLEAIATAKGERVPPMADVEELKRLGERLQRLQKLGVDELAELQRFNATPAEIAKAEEAKANKSLTQQATIKRDMATIWASMWRPLTLRSFTSQQGLINVRDAARDYVVLNLLSKIGHVTRFPIHLATQVATHFGSRPLAVAFEAAGRQGNTLPTWEAIAKAYRLEWEGFKGGLRPAVVGGRAEALGRGEGRNVDALMHSMNTFGRIDRQAEKYWAEGNYPMWLISRILGVPEYAGKWISVVDQWQGAPAVYADVLHQAEIEMVRAGWNPAERVRFQGELVKAMKYEIQQAILESAVVLKASGEEVTPRQIEENAWGLVKYRLQEMATNRGLPGAGMAETTEALRRQLSWQDEVRRGVGGVIGKGVGLMGKVFPPLGAFGNAIGHGINWTVAKLPPGLHYLADINLIGKEGREPSNFFRTSLDKKQRLIESIGVTMVGGLLAGLILNRMARFNPFISTAQERAEMEKEGRKPGTIDFMLPDGRVSTWSLIVGPMTLFAPWIASFGAWSNLQQRREHAQAALDAKAAREGLPAGKIREISVADWAGVALHAAVASILGSKTAGGWTTQFVDPNQGFAAKRTLAGQIAPFVPGLPGWQEVSRMMGVSMRQAQATVWDYLVPMPGSAARAVNALGDPIGTRNGVERVVQVLTGGSYPIPHVPQNRDEEAYQALANSGYQLPTISPNRGFNVNGEYRPLNDSELTRYVGQRGQLLKAALANLGPNATREQVQAAFQEANQTALDGIGAKTLRQTGVTTGATPRLTGRVSRLSRFGGRRTGTGRSATPHRQGRVGRLSRGVGTAKTRLRGRQRVSVA